MVSSVDYSHVPAFNPPQGITANFIDPPTIACSVLEVSLPLSVISTAFVAVRIYTRLKIVKSPGWDDLLLGIGLVLSWTFCALGIIEGQYGYGVDIWNLYTTDAINFLKLDLASQTIYHLALLTTKLSILLMLLHLTSNTAPSSPFRISVFSIMAFTAIYSLTYVFIAIFGCSPVAAAWDIRIEAGKCIDKTAYAYAYGGCNILSSWAIFGLGLVVCLRNGLIRRRVGREVRWCLGIVLAVGCFVCIASIIRLVIAIPYLHSENFTRFKVYIARWCEIELTSAILLASLLAIYPLLTVILPSYFPHHTPTLQNPSFTPCPSRKMSLPASTASSQPSNTMSSVSSRRDVSLEESEIGLGSNAGGIAMGERRVLGGSVGKKGAVVKTVVYDVRYEA
ncbi:hypothetical protein DL95DRAFT_520687 [Leptodontidium sp. 2 PMI_412]|nr:hypothetical protein DL95DRAFT_520687 [Leptodontidium sp. 2 PMI_412]